MYSMYCTIQLFVRRHMNSKITVIMVVVVIAMLGGLAISTRSSTAGEKMTNNADTAMEKVSSAPVTAMMEKSDTMMKKESRYVDYTRAAFDSAKGKKRVFFFHASWCPTCKVVNAEIMGNPQGIPEDVVLFKTDYDANVDLKKQYSITYQHTFVLVDDMGKEVKKWNGGGLTELSANTR